MRFRHGMGIHTSEMLAVDAGAVCIGRRGLEGAALEGATATRDIDGLKQQTSIALPDPTAT